MSEARENIVEVEAIDAQLVQLRDAHAMSVRECESASAILAALMDRVGVATRADFDAAVDRAERHREIDGEVRQLELQLVELGDGAALDGVIKETLGVDADVLEAEWSTIETRVADVAREISHLDQKIGRLAAALDMMDGRSDAAVAAQGAETAAAHVRDAVSRYAKLRLAEGLLRRHIDSYRDRYQGPLLRRAASWFERFTLGEFKRLDTHIGDDERPVISGVRATGARVDVTGMSEGTRDQLFLALRLAALHHALETRTVEPFPFIVDDVLVGFDDARARAAFEVLGELSDHMQIIFFTHHGHLAEIAADAVGRGRYFEHKLGALV